MSDSALPRLLVPREEARKKIKEQREKGSQILFSVTPGLQIEHLRKMLEKAKRDSTRWAQFTIDLLTTLFAGMQIGREFGDSWVNASAYSARELTDWMNTRLNRLDSILERLDLFPLQSDAVKSKANPYKDNDCNTTEIFIVHGHDDGLKHEVARLIERLELTPVILHEQIDKGRTIIEKFEEHSGTCGFAVVLLTPDDIGSHKDQCANQKSRARQNVIFELGFFVGRLGRQRVCALQKGDIELPSDYMGVLYKQVDTAGAWKSTLAREIKGSGISLDISKASY
jgi:predicted nucleotide-binding protein